MPIYEYRCESCDKELEKIQKFSDPPLTECPACGKSTLKKLVSASSFRLKGSGWYETDFKNKKKPEAGDSNTSDEKKAGKADDSDKSKSEKSEKSTDSSKKEAKKTGSD